VRWNGAACAYRSLDALAAIWSERTTRHPSPPDPDFTRDRGLGRWLDGVQRLPDAQARTIYHKESTFGFIRDFHEKTGGWPRSWQSLEQTIDVRSPFPFADITRSVSVRWENLGKEIDLRTDWYLKTESNLSWKGQDLNRELLEYIHAANHREEHTEVP
jgi:hypothetical protein